MSLRARFLIELGALGAATAVFLAVFPRRPIAVDIVLALVALALLLSTARFTWREVWRLGERTREDLKASIRWIAVFTIPAVALFLLFGAVAAYREKGGPGITERILNPNLALAVLLYLPWALLQETLFQFYLLGRLKTIFDGRYPFLFCALNAVGYSLVHMPEIPVCIATGLAGVVWSWLYLRYRHLLPIAASHAILGATFYYWAIGKDLVAAHLGAP